MRFSGRTCRPAGRLAIWFTFAGALACGCGYSSGLRISDRHQNIGIEFFGNDSYERDLERPFDDEMTLALRSYSDAPIVSVSKADVIVRGRIRSYGRRSGIRSQDNVLLETGVSIEVEAMLVERGTERVLRGPFRASSAIGYLVGPTENELEARDRALHHIAEELVLDLFGPQD